MTNTDVTNMGLIATGGARAPQAMAQVYEQHFSGLMRNLRMVYPRLSEAEAADFVAQTFVHSFEKAKTYRGDSSLRTWLMRIATNLVIDAARRRATVPMLSVEDSAEAQFSWDNAQGDDNPDHHAQRKQMADCVRTQFELFRRRHPQPAWALWSRMCEETNLEELATLLEKTNGATRQYLSEWAQKLREILAPCRLFLSDL